MHMKNQTHRILKSKDNKIHPKGSRGRYIWLRVLCLVALFSELFHVFTSFRYKRTNPIKCKTHLLTISISESKLVLLLLLPNLDCFSYS